jgi:hypothetical protein
LAIEDNIILSIRHGGVEIDDCQKKVRTKKEAWNNQANIKSITLSPHYLGII